MRPSLLPPYTQLSAEAKRLYPDLYRAWREEPAAFNVDGVYPVRELWVQARETWRELLGAQVREAGSFSEWVPLKG